MKRYISWGEQMDTTNKERIVEGYLFLSEEDEELAKQEKKKIEYLEKHMDYSSTENVLRVYKKAIVERVFKTPVGHDYLKGMQNFLIRCGTFDENEIPPIALYSNYGMKMRQSYSPAREHVKASEKKKSHWPVISVIANIILALMVVAMLSIANQSDNLNIINYETNLVDKYATWEQELSAREKVIREKERELNIN